MAGAAAPPPDALELEHCVGWTGRFPNTLLAHPAADTAFFAALGTAVVLGDVLDPHKQRFLRGHDAAVSALAVSATGALLASGQQRSTQVATGDASVMVWDVARGSAVFTFHGLTEGVTHVAFSPDERFLAAAAADNTLAVWDMTSGEQARCCPCAPRRAAAPTPPFSRTHPFCKQTPPPAPICARRCTLSGRARAAARRLASTFWRGAP